MQSKQVSLLAPYGSFEFLPIVAKAGLHSAPAVQQDRKVVRRSVNA